MLHNAIKQVFWQIAKISTMWQSLQNEKGVQRERRRTPKAPTPLKLPTSTPT